MTVMLALTVICVWALTSSDEPSVLGQALCCSARRHEHHYSSQISHAHHLLVYRHHVPPNWRVVRRLRVAFQPEGAFPLRFSGMWLMLETDTLVFVHNNCTVTLSLQISTFCFYSICPCVYSLHFVLRWRHLHTPLSLSVTVKIGCASFDANLAN